MADIKFPAMPARPTSMDAGPGCVIGSAGAGAPRGAGALAPGTLASGPVSTGSLSAGSVSAGSASASPGPAAPAAPGAGSGQGSPEPIWDIIELLYFAYRDFVSDPDSVLVGFGFGRAHHRVLHFVFRNPGMKVAELLDLLRITKQSLGRVLKQLVDEGFIEQREGETDRRQRRLFATPKGEALSVRLAMLQTRRIDRALAEIGPDAHDEVRRFLVGMIDVRGRDDVLDLVDGATGVPRTRGRRF
ncbi:HTH-type transcriptional regulator PetP [Rhodovulum sp. PH10]|uniref:MarR family winged helix-turn-helix transcriptional regulator n=1 Tax=Rhodovulum sp. PH10 TaxID=1187851 RepID=UPI00027C1D76|nr:MarR family transcriptional regulator [Rhodovulum sp. PH10]EJW13638.1 HTH-type transcriptional regulator PetP [Rhodovulum sp. PH10]